MSDAEDPNVARIAELKTKIESGGELTSEEEEFLDGIVASGNYGVTSEETEEETEEYED